MPSIELTKDNVKVQMQLTHSQIISFEQMLEQIKDLASQMLEAWMQASQRQRLRKLLGEKWTRHPDRQIGLGCPRCGSIALRRKCWRTRQLNVAGLPAVSAPRRQLRCTDCGRTWMPFAEALRLPSGQYGPTLAEQALDRVLQVSYQKAAEAAEQGPSAASLHRMVQGQEPPEPQLAPDQTVVVDGTQVPGWRSGGQISLSLAHQLGPDRGHDQQRPPRRQRQVVAATGGREAAVTEALDPLRIRSLVHDGNLALDDQADHVGRCRWHVPYTVRHLLYRDQIKGTDNTTRTNTLRGALIGREGDPKGLARRLKNWMADNADAPIACRHVQASLDGLLEVAAHPEAFTVQTTSHLEREMVELNKRFENGGGWTAQGAQNLLWLHQLNRFEPDKYEQVKQQLIQQTVFPN